MSRRGPDLSQVRVTVDLAFEDFDKAVREITFKSSSLMEPIDFKHLSVDSWSLIPTSIFKKGGLGKIMKLDSHDPKVIKCLIYLYPNTVTELHTHTDRIETFIVWDGVLHYEYYTDNSKTKLEAKGALRQGDRLTIPPNKWHVVLTTEEHCYMLTLIEAI